MLCGRCRRHAGHDDVDTKADKLSGNIEVTFGTAFCPAINNRDTSALNPTQFAQSFCKSTGPCHGRRRSRAQEPYGIQSSLRLLRPCCERPAGGRTTKQSNELAPPHIPLPISGECILAIQRKHRKLGPMSVVGHSLPTYSSPPVPLCPLPL